jgi:hypothetical protein
MTGDSFFVFLILLTLSMLMIGLGFNGGAIACAHAFGEQARRGCRYA